ncbi:MAG TPA: lipoyl synthase [Actinobacteria bacterium]|nr:lipoyl synthase [Actinomycetota bacterium]
MSKYAKPKVDVDSRIHHNTTTLVRKPLHLRVRVSQGANYRAVKSILQDLRLHTVCEEAGCPNIYECFEAKTATFLILGETCTRNCRFCLVSDGTPHAPDADEPTNVANAVAELGLRYVVITSVTRDDLADGGASVFAGTIRAVRLAAPGCIIEVLIPDLGGDWDALQAVVDAAPDVLNHNIETVPRLYSAVRPAAVYERSLLLLSVAKEQGFSGSTKSGIMVGLGEKQDEVAGVLADLRGHGCDIVTIGQYLAPSKEHFPVARYYDPEEFDQLKQIGYRLGFSHVESAPLVRSSYHAHEQYRR